LAIGTTADADLTRNELIELALGNCGVEEPSNDDYVLGAKVLNTIIRKLDPLGKWLHATDITESTLTLISAQQSYTTGATANDIATNIAEIDYIAIFIGSDRDPPLRKLTKNEFVRSPLKNEDNSQPIAFYLERKKLLTDNVLWFLPTPNSSYSCVYNYRRPIYDFDGPTDNPDMPTEFNDALISLLAAKLGYRYGLTPAERQELRQEGTFDFITTRSALDKSLGEGPVETEYF